MILFILNICDYILTLNNLGKFEEANPIMELVLDNIVLLSFIKLILVPVFIFILYKNRNNKIVKISYPVICLIYLYAVTLGVMIALS